MLATKTAEDRRYSAGAGSFATTNETPSAAVVSQGDKYSSDTQRQRTFMVADKNAVRNATRPDREIFSEKNPGSSGLIFRTNSASGAGLGRRGPNFDVAGGLSHSAFGGQKKPGHKSFSRHRVAGCGAGQHQHSSVSLLRHATSRNCLSARSLRNPAFTQCYVLSFVVEPHEYFWGPVPVDKNVGRPPGMELQLTHGAENG